MPFDQMALLTAVSPERPCGEPLEAQELSDAFKRLAAAPTRPDWARFLEQAIQLAGVSRDLRAWVWLTRAALSAHGVQGLAAGLKLLATGLERFWDVLPPQYEDEPDPAERFMVRLTALTQLGATNANCTLAQLQGSGRTLADLRADLDAMVAKAPSDAATQAAIEDARAATGAIMAIFADRYGPGRDPQLGFELILGRLQAIEARLGKGVAAAPTALPAAAAPVPARPGIVASRDDVVRALDQVLDYYRAHEPSSPVPLLVQRAKRLVPLSFLEAIRDLAPAGLKELQAVAGAADEKKQA